MPDRFCQHCGHPLQPDDRFCMACGQPANRSTDPTAVPAAPPPTPNEAGSYTPPPPSSMPPYSPQPMPAAPRKQSGLLIALVAVAALVILAGGLFIGYRLLGGRENPPPGTTPTPLATESGTTQSEQTTPISETTSSGTDDLSWIIPAGSSWFNQDQLAQLTPLAAGAADGAYEGRARIHSAEALDLLPGGISETQQSAMTSVTGQELQASGNLAQDELTLYIELPEIGWTLMDIMPLRSLENGYFIDNRQEDSETDQYTVDSTLIALPGNQDIRLLFYIDFERTEPAASRFVIEFDLERIQSATDPTTDITEPSDDDTGAADTTPPTEFTDDFTRRTDGLPEAYAYAPKPGRSYLYEVVYPDGEIGYEQIVIGQQGDVLSSTITFFDDSGYGGDDYDYDSREDGIYVVYPESDYQSLWLPHDYQEFDLWELEWETYMIMAVDQTVTSGTYTFEDVLVRYYENTAAEYYLTEYLVPGHGVVYSESSPGVPVRTLIEWSEIGIDEANQQFYR